MQEPSYTIKTAATLTDLNAHTIRAWERRYKALEPGRHENGRRQYTQEDVRRLKLLVKLVNSGHSISSVAGLTTALLEAMCQDAPVIAPLAIADKAAENPRSQTPEAVSSMILDNCIYALRSYDLVSINSELESARFFLSAKEFVSRLAVPLLAKVGELVGRDQLSIAQEHALSAVLRAQLMQILFNVRNAIAVRSFTRKDLPKGKTFALATQEGDLHEFGVLAAAIIVAANGHVPHYFGANMPVTALSDAAKAIHADIVIVGVTHIPKDRRVLSDLEFAMQLESRLPENTMIWWGGRVDISKSFFDKRPGHRLLSTLEDLDTALKQASHTTH